jgi:predicted transcriptional regulator
MPFNLYIQSPRLNQLNILREITVNAHITQAELAGRCALSVAMVNNYMKDLCRQKFLRYHRKSIKNVSYHLTSAGTRHLEQLQKERIGEMAQLFGEAKSHILDQIMDAPGGPPRRLALYGSGNLAQLVFLAMQSSGLAVLCVCDDATNGEEMHFCGCSIEHPLRLRRVAPDAVIVTDEPKTQESAEILESLQRTGTRLIRLDNELTPRPELLAAAERGAPAQPEYKQAPYLQYQEI